MKERKEGLRVRGREGRGWGEKRIIVCFCSERVLFFGAAERRPLLRRVYQWDRSSEITHPDSRPQTWSPQAAGGGLPKIISPIQHQHRLCPTTKLTDISPSSAHLSVHTSDPPLQIKVKKPKTKETSCNIFHYPGSDLISFFCLNSNCGASFWNWRQQSTTVYQKYLIVCRWDCGVFWVLGCQRDTVILLTFLPLEQKYENMNRKTLYCALFIGFAAAKKKVFIFIKTTCCRKQESTPTNISCCYTP